MQVSGQDQLEFDLLAPFTTAQFFLHIFTLAQHERFVRAVLKIVVLFFFLYLQMLNEAEF